MIFAKLSTAITIPFGPVLDSSGAEYTSLVVGEVKISKNGGTPAALNGSATLTHKEVGIYELVLTTSDISAVGQATLTCSKTTYVAPPVHLAVLPAKVYDSLVGGTDNLEIDAVQWLGTACATPTVAGVPEVDVTHFAGTAATASSGRPEVNTTHIAGSAVSTSSAQIGVNVVNAGGTAWGSGAITAGSIASDAITAAKIADGAIDAATFAAGAINAAAIASDAITDAKVASDVTIASVTGAVGSVTGNVGGNVTGSVGSIATGGIAAASFAAGAIDAAAIAANAIGASELAADAVAEIADAVWDEAIAGHAAAGSTGEALGAAGSAGDPWTTALPGAYGAGTAGKIIGDNLNATVSSRASQTSVDDVDNYIDTEVAAITTELAKVPKSDGTSSWNATALAAINAEADTALTDYGALKPTTAGRTLDVTGTGAAGIDWSNIENPTTTVGLTGTTVKDSTDVTTALAAVYQATILYIKDDAAAQDEWTVQFFKNGVPLTSGITSPTLTVKNSSGTTIINAGSMTQIGSTGVYKYDATTTERVSAGIAMIATAAATIDAGSRSFTLLKGRDTTA